jgi:cysteine desulfurase
MTRPIYLDYPATTPCDPRVVQAMLPYFTEEFGNPSSSLHALGRGAARVIDEAREQVASLIGGRPRGVVFTSGATEANNLAILGLAREPAASRRRIVTTPIEHKSVLEPLHFLARQGYEIAMLPVDRTGAVSLKAANDLIDERTLLVSVQAANNEIGTIQPIAAIARIAHAHGALVHCDAAQAVGKIPIDVERWSIDFLSLSAHKLYGPKGTGALYIAQHGRSVRVSPIILGGGQEGGIRSGTHNVPGIVGLGAACVICTAERDVEAERVGGLRDRFEAQLIRHLPGIRINGDLLHRLPGNTSVTFPGVEADALILNLPDLALSMGSACNSGAIEPSYVLTAIGLSRDDAFSTIRVGLGRFTGSDEVSRAAHSIADAVARMAVLA